MSALHDQLLDCLEPQKTKHAHSPRTTGGTVPASSTFSRQTMDEYLRETIGPCMHVCRAQSPGKRLGTFDMYLRKTGTLSSDKQAGGAVRSPRLHLGP